MITISVALPHCPRRVQFTKSVLAYCDGGGVSDTLFAFTPLLMGGFFVWGLICRGIPKLLTTHSTVPQFLLTILIFLAILLISFLFIVIGMWLIFGRTSVVFDRSTSKVRVCWSMILRGKLKVYDLKNYSGVNVRRTGGSWKTGPTYSVFLTGQNAPSLKTAKIKISWEKAEQTGSEIAMFLGLPLATDDDS